ncbi:MAG: hypothetical protein WB771_12720 [Solirubrobacterales bacterium]
MPGHPGISRSGCVDPKEIWMTWDSSAAADTVNRIASLGRGDVAA